MTVKYQKNKSFVTVKIKSDFITNDVCKECDIEGAHHGPNHVFKITLTETNTETNEMRIFNDYNEFCVIPPNTAAFKALESYVRSGNICYFYGKLDEDDRSAMYINIKDLPQQ